MLLTLVSGCISPFSVKYMCTATFARKGASVKDPKVFIIPPWCMFVYAISCPYVYNKSVENKPTRVTHTTNHGSC